MTHQIPSPRSHILEASRVLRALSAEDVRVAASHRYRLEEAHYRRLVESSVDRHDRELNVRLAEMAEDHALFLEGEDLYSRSSDTGSTSDGTET